MKTNKFTVNIINVTEIDAVKMLTRNLKKGASVKVISFKETEMNKGRGINTNPYLGRVFERTSIGGWVVGTNYNKSCQNAAERSGSTETFKSKPSWHTYYNSFFEVNKKNDKKFYLQLQKSAKTGSNITKVYFLDGKKATKEQIKEIEKWLPKSEQKQSSSQIEAGIDKEHERKYMCVTLANIETIEQGETIYHVNINQAEKKEEEKFAEVTIRK